jgi:hypothetical protein
MKPKVAIKEKLGVTKRVTRGRGTKKKKPGIPPGFLGL